jgi:uncharacterized FAD-dependent dehydrogenase
MVFTFCRSPKGIIQKAQHEEEKNEVMEDEQNLKE